MGEKKQLKISLGAAICIFIIIVLILALAGTVIYYNKNNGEENVEKSNNVEENIDEIAKKLYERAEHEIVMLHASDLTREYNLKSPRIEKEINGETYVATTEKYEVIENKYKEIFTDEALKNILETWRYANVDGELYVSVAGGGSGWNTTITDLEKTDVKDEEITYVGTGITQENEFSEKTEIYFKIKKVNGEYRISEMDLLRTEEEKVSQDESIIGQVEENSTQLENNNEEIKNEYVGTWNTKAAFDSQGQEVELSALLGSGYTKYGSKIILNEDGTFEDLIQPIQSGEISNTGTWEYQENIGVPDMIWGKIVLNYDDGREEILQLSTGEDSMAVLIYSMADNYQLHLYK